MSWSGITKVWCRTKTYIFKTSWPCEGFLSHTLRLDILWDLEMVIFKRPLALHSLETFINWQQHEQSSFVGHFPHWHSWQYLPATSISTSSSAVSYESVSLSLLSNAWHISTFIISFHVSLIYFTFFLLSKSWPIAVEIGSSLKWHKKLQLIRFQSNLDYL